MLRMLCLFISGAVCVRGCFRVISLISCLCILMSGWMYVLLRLAVPPDGDVPDQVWVHVDVVELLHDEGWEELVGVFEALDKRSKLFDYFGDCSGVLGVFLDNDSK